MAQDQFEIIQPTVVRKPGRKRGPLSSENYNDFQDAVAHDIVNMTTAINTVHTQLVNAMQNVYEENQFLKRRVDELVERQRYKEFTFGKSGTKVARYVDFHNSANIEFPTTIDDEKLASYAAQFGELALPANAIENKFYNLSLRTREIVVPSDFSYEVTGVFDKADGAGTQDYEKGGTITEGNPKNVFNGINDTVWSRRVTFPLESDVDEVEVRLTAVVPAGISSEANLIELIPFPEGSVDILELSTAPDLGSAFTMVDNFAEQNNVVAKRFHFSPRSVEQVRVRLRSRNWSEVNGKKVFNYGLRELGAKLVDYKKYHSDADAFGDNFTSIVKISPPEGFVFNSIFRVDPDPDFLLEDADSRHIRLRLSTTPDFSGTIWDSSTDIPPQAGLSTGVTVGGADHLYAIYTFKFVKTSGGFQSPFSVGSTPYASGLGLGFGLASS